ncbi:dirigent protein 21-like [Salvia hispanica]|uniref:dirigent protein 21-like n=1 Tax=Salvia hispanica TaxID=49212 RepID=UPI0020097567|nr:dirigent protein 21-like [Salvia hispanica]
MKNLTIALMLIATTSLLLLLPTARATGAWVETITKGHKKLTKFHFYVHDPGAGPNATLFRVANASITDTSPTVFGQVMVFDDRVTADPDIKSAQVARAQGTAASADLQNLAVALTMNFHITSGEYNGSTVCIAGRNPLLAPSREVPVIGGTGAFRFARGYAITSTYSMDLPASYIVLEYTIYVITSDHEIVWPST